MTKVAVFLLLSTLAGLSYGAEPKQVLAAFHTALASGDKVKATELLAPQVTIYESGFVERSRSEYASHHLTDDIAFAKTSTRTVLRQSERVDGNFAVIWEETSTQGKSNGKDLHMLGTETALLEKKNDRWLIVHVHWSSRKAK
jgi:hypothetical protein